MATTKRAAIKHSALTSLLLASVAVIALAPTGAGAQQWSDQGQQYNRGAWQGSQQDSGFRQFGQNYPSQNQFEQHGQSYGQNQYGQQNQRFGVNPFQHPTESAFGQGNGGPQFGPGAEARMVQEADRNGDGEINTQEYIQYRRDALQQMNRGDYAAYYDDAFQAYPGLQGSLRDDRFSMPLQEGQAGQPPGYGQSAYDDYRQSHMQPFGQRDLTGDGEVDAEDYLRWRQQAMQQRYSEYRQDFRTRPEMGRPYAMYDLGGYQGDRSLIPRGQDMMSPEARQRAYLWSGEDQMQGQYNYRPGYGEVHTQNRSEWDSERQVGEPRGNPQHGQSYGQDELDRFGQDYPQGGPEPYPQFGQAPDQGQYSRYGASDYGSGYGQSRYGANDQGLGGGSGDPMDRLSAQEVRESLHAQGYSDISSITDKGYTYAVQASRDGQNVTLEIDARTGHVVDAWRG